MRECFAKSVTGAAVLIAAMSAVPRCAGAADWQLIIVGAPDLVGVSAALDVTPDGATVVGTTDGAVFRWTEAAGVQILSPHDWLHTHTAGVSDDGTRIASTVFHTSSGLFEPSRWTEGLGWEPLGGLPGQTPPDDAWGSGYDISGDGSLVVGLGWHTDYRAEAFQWTQAAGMVGLGKPPSSSSRASAVSRDGHVVGGFYEHETAGYRRPARWTDGGPVDLILGLEIPGEVAGVSSDGSFLTGEWVPPGDDSPVAFLYGDAGGPIQIPPVWPSPTHRSFGNAVSDAGVVVGWSGDQSVGDVEAGVWFPGDLRMRSMADWLTARGVAIPAGWVLVSALAISPDATAVVGQAFNSSTFEYGAFILRMPEIILDSGFEFGGFEGWSAVVGLAE